MIRFPDWVKTEKDRNRYWADLDAEPDETPYIPWDQLPAARDWVAAGKVLPEMPLEADGTPRYTIEKAIELRSGRKWWIGAWPDGLMVLDPGLESPVRNSAMRRILEDQCWDGSILI